MTDAQNTKQSVVEMAAGIAPASSIAEILKSRAEILELTGESHDAVLTPRGPGGLGHSERAALACRMARLSGDSFLAAHYGVLLAKAGSSKSLDAIANAEDGEDDVDARFTAIVRHVDLLTSEPRRARREDIEALKEAGVAEGDIVRLAELAAFVSYQVRLTAGLRLLKVSQ